MKNIFKKKFGWLVLVTFTIICFTSSKVNAADEKISVFVSIIPQKFFVEQIGKDRVDVQVMVQPGASPHTYEPKPQQMAALSKTRVYFAVGLPFEHVWLGKISAANRQMKVVDTDEGIEKIQMVADDHHEEGQHKEEGNNHKEAGEPDPHIWLSPKLVAIQAQHILNGLKAVDPASSDIYNQNYQTFILQIQELDKELKGIFSDKKGIQFMVFHPSWGYFARDYQIEELPIEIEGKNPKPSQLQELIRHARERKIQVIFVQPQFSAKSAEQIAKEINGQVLFADPLAYDWLKNIRGVADKFKASLK